MEKILFVPLNQNHVLIFKDIISELEYDYEILCHDYISEAKQYHTEKIIVKHNLKYRHFKKKINCSENNNILSRITLFFKIKTQIKSILKEIKPNIVVLALDNDPISQSIIKESKKFGIKTALVSEGLLKPYEFKKQRKKYNEDYFYDVLRIFGIYINYIPYGSGGCDRIFVSGKIAYEILKNNGVDHQKMIIVGQQKYDSFIKRINKNSLEQNKIRKYLYAGSTRIFSNTSEIKMVNLLAKHIKNQSVSLVIKLHPRIQQEAKELYNLIDRDYWGSVTIIKEGYDTFDVLKTIDIVITISSAIVLEALMMDKECIAINYLAGNKKFEYQKYNAIFEINNEKDIESVIIDTKINKKDYSNKKALLEDEIYKLDGKAGYRTAIQIKNMLVTKN